MKDMSCHKEVTYKRRGLMYFLYNNEYRIFKPIEFTIRRDYGRKEENRGGESIQVIIHIYVKKSQGNQCIAIISK
jgi:hypothetical protein